MALKSILRLEQKRLLIGIFAAAGVSCYYWYRIPALLGFGYEGNDGLLVNLRNIIPEWIITVSTLATTIFFFYWLIVRNPNKKSWVIRPNFAKGMAIKK